MKQVNIHFIVALLNPLVGGADDDELIAEYRSVDPDSEAQMRDVIRSRLLPYVKRFDAKSREMAETSLRYFLSAERTDFTRLYDSCLLPIETPSNPRRFFVLLWEELFGEEPYLLEDLGEFQENNNIYAPNGIRLVPADEA